MKALGFAVGLWCLGAVTAIWLAGRAGAQIAVQILVTLLLLTLAAALVAALRRLCRWAQALESRADLQHQRLADLESALGQERAGGPAMTGNWPQ